MLKRSSIRLEIWNVCCILLGVLLATIGLKGFLVPSHFIDGGAMGVALLGNVLSGINVSLLIALVNIPLVLLSYFNISLQFAIRSTISISLLSISLYYVKFPVFTNDPLLIAIFGGFFLGAGIGVTIRGNSVIDGTEVLAIFVSRRGMITEGDFILIFNAILFLSAAFLIDIETAMYSMLSYLAASKTVDFVVDGIEEYIGVTIISEKHKELKDRIQNNLNHGVTVYLSGDGFHDVKDQPPVVLYCVITRFEISRLNREIESIDPDAFIVQSSLRDVRGGHFRRLPHR